ncbi:hypothetical protein N7450_010048 [Penicillium hetheringtonii]|uniref:Rad50/SbcC-type AAA domain-containing protein n=1 Tax=Penicillium hetheringtonii TaxID=911720 RepID=A0AAD6GMY2_9EURO|nr:hypothetical protein N7450_010048 [Penicillium hetheringtonii]
MILKVAAQRPSSENDASDTSPDDLSLEDEDEDELEIRQTQIIQEKYAHIVDETNKPAEQGILERVECYNFMCHDHFSVELGPLINFIVGKNGSGKSAILTAITLCLGGKASATQRGGSLKSFVKQGKENATIIVRIKNSGDGAYMSSDYGKSIIVERHFSRTGASGFKLKAENGRIVSTKKAELDAITDYFSMQIDNPMNVLSQDSARQFLSTSSPAEKYKFFVKGVQLEQLDQDYRLIEESVDQIEEKLRTKAEDIRILENRRNAAKRKLEISDQQDSLRDRRKNIRNQMAWAQVEEQEKVRDTIQGTLNNADEAIVASEAALGQFDEEFRAIEAEAETAAETAYNADLALEEARGEQEKIKEKLDKIMEERGELQAQQRSIREYLKGAESRINERQREIADETRRLAEASDGGYARKQEELSEAEEQATAAKDNVQRHAEGESALHADIREAMQEESYAKNEWEAKKGDVAQAEARLHTLRREDGQRQSGFPDRMPSLLRAIEKESSFSSRPVGPIGNHVTLLQPKWSSVLETTFGATLHSFIVSSKRDMNILMGVMRQVNCVCPVFIGEIDNPMVRRQLIIGHGVEQMLLIENLEEASSVLFDGTSRPKNVKRCYCIDSRDRRRGITLSYNQMGDPSQSPVRAYPGHPRMKSDLASQVSAQRDVVHDLQRQLRELETAYESAKSRTQARKQALARHKAEAGELKIEMQRMEDHVESLREELERENPEDGRLDSLKEALKEAEEDKMIQDGSYGDSVRAMNKMVQDLKEIRREQAAKDQHVSDLVNRSKVASDEQKLVEHQRRDLIHRKNNAIGDIDKQRTERTRVKDKLDQAEARVLDYSEKASQISPRVAVDEGETLSSLDQKLTKLNRDLERYSQQLGGTRDEIAAEAGRTEAAYAQAMKQVEELSTLAQIFKDTLDNRKKRWEDFQVEPDITKDDPTGRGAKTLSGGEKSFSQICLLLALWEAMGSPIRCLDEFDVYMDHINRKMAIDMLMVAARRSVGRQFILITPGTKTDITISPDVRVKELAEPERGQTSLNFQRR